MTVIEPTIGRIVWFWRNPEAMESPGAQPWAAIVTYVHSDHLVNLATFDPEGGILCETSVVLLQEGDAIPDQSAFCQWMPYQIGQAKKHAEK